MSPRASVHRKHIIFISHHHHNYFLQSSRCRFIWPCICSECDKNLPRAAQRSDIYQSSPAQVGLIIRKAARTKGFSILPSRLPKRPKICFVASDSEISSKTLWRELCEQQRQEVRGSLSVFFEAVKPHAYHTTILHSQKFLWNSCENTALLCVFRSSISTRIKTKKTNIFTESRSSLCHKTTDILMQTVIFDVGHIWCRWRGESRIEDSFISTTSHAPK